MKIFNWLKAAQLIKAKGCDSAIAFLQNDRYHTAGFIFLDGEIVSRSDSTAYLASEVDEPVIEIAGEVISCGIEESDSPGWSLETWWPDEAVEVLKLNQRRTCWTVMMRDEEADYTVELFDSKEKAEKHILDHYSEPRYSSLMYVEEREIL